MKILLTLCLLLSVHVWAQLNCTDIACIQMVPECGEGSCITLAGCCEACCERNVHNAWWVHARIGLAMVTQNIPVERTTVEGATAYGTMELAQELNVKLN